MRLIDADKLPYEDIESIDGNTYMCVNAYDIEHAPTIEQSEDCVSRDEVLKDQLSVYTKEYGEIDVVAVEYIESLPSVTPSYNSIKTELKPCEDCISRETAIDQFIHWYSELLLSQKEEASFEDILKSLPSVLPQHKKGKWIRYDVDIAFHPLHCSICGWSNHHIINKCIEEFQFCPNCGADMRESEDVE